MRFQVTFCLNSRQRMLPMDYQYYISAWIYKVVKRADKEYAHYLHEKGYGNNGNKLYKLFCFSPLNFNKPTLWKEKRLFEIKTPNPKLSISFDVPEAASTFIKGLFMEQEFFLGNKFNGLDLKVVSVEALPEPEFAHTMKYTLCTPWVVSYKTENQKNARYLTPEDEQFNHLSIRHIVEKYNNTREGNISENDVSFVPDNTFKRSGFVIKPGTPQQTRVVGNIFDFALSAPAEVHKMIWHAGISEKSSSGFGWLEMNNQQQSNK